MKSELRLKPHHLLPGEQVVEVWYNGELIATVTGADGPGIRVISKYKKEACEPDGTRIGEALWGTIEIRIDS